MHAAFVSPVIFDILGDGGSEDTDSPAFSLLLPPLSKMTADCNMQQMRSVLLKTGCKKLVQGSMKTGGRGFRKLGEDQSKSPGEAWRTGGLTGEAGTKGPSKHKRPGSEAESSIDCVKKSRGRPKSSTTQGKSM